MSEAIGTVTAVKRLWWIKVNTKPVRAHATDGARFPHFITVSYTVDSTSYCVTKYVSWRKECPKIGQQVSILYQPSNPRKVTVVI